MGRTDFLFVMPNLLNGASRVLDLAGLYDSGSYNESRTTAEADAWALSNDWAVVGNDIEDAMEDSNKEGKKDSK